MVPVVFGARGDGRVEWVRTYPAPLCETCNVPMWLVAPLPDDGPRGTRRAYCCGICGATLRIHRPRSPRHHGDDRASG
jgi:hypothetical protein